MSQYQGSGVDAPVDVSVVIPCYNEEAGIARIGKDLAPALHELCVGHSVEVVFVDDGSTDGTWTALKTLAASPLHGARVVLQQHDRNRGLGAALRTGFAVCQGDIIVTTDSDATYRFTEIPALVSRLAPDVAIVTASPYHPLGQVAGVPRYRLVLSRGSSLIYRTLVSRGIYTYTSLFRAYRAEVIRRVSFESDGFLAVAELLVNALFLGYRIAEYPTVLHSRVAGTSKAKLVRTIIAHLRFQFGIILRRLGIGPRPAPAMATHAEWPRSGVKSHRFL
jgi:dolichol-phosphate mannosyltransferase